MTPVPETESESDGLKRDFGAACAQAEESARGQIAHELNQLFRRFRHYEKEADWVRLVMEGVGAYARQVALFAVQADAFELRGSTNLELPERLRLEPKNAAAFEAVLHSKEPVTALRSSGEVGPALASQGKLANLFPVLNGSRVAAVLFAAAEDSHVDQIELIASMAGCALERPANSVHGKIAVAPISQVAERHLPAWANMPQNSAPSIHKLPATPVSLLRKCNS